MPPNAGGELPEWTGATRATLTILVVDLVESVRLYESFANDVMQRWLRFVAEVRDELLPRHRGRLVRHLGDGMLITFDLPRDAASAAFAIHRCMGSHNVGCDEPRRMLLRIGLHVDAVVVEQIDIFGAGVNLAARIATLAGPGETVGSVELHDQLCDDIDAVFEDLGECFLKHISRPVRAFRMTAPAAITGLGADREPPRLPAPDELRITIAVLPFEVQADDGAAASAGDLLADELIAVLSRGTQLRMISRLSTAALRYRNFDVGEIGRQLGARYVVSGRLRVQQGRLTAVVELSDSAEGSVIWADRRTASVAELTAPDAEIVLGVASALSDAVARHEIAHVRRRPLPTIASYALLLGGISLMHRFASADFERARECLTTLSERVPRHAEPYAWLARWHVFRAVQGWTDNPVRERAEARDLCRRALDLDPASAIALAIAGSAHIALEKDIDEGQRRYEEALAINPSEPLAWVLLGTANSYRGHGEEALRCCRRALALTPLDPMRFYYDVHTAAAAVAAGAYDLGVELATRSLRANRTHHSTIRTLAIAQSLAGQMDAARETVRQILAVQPDLTVSSFLRGSPAAPFEHGRRLGEALRLAGLPA